MGRTIEQLVNQDKVVLDGLLVELGKVGATQLDQAVEELKDQSGIGVAFCDSDNEDVLMLDMAEGGGTESQDRRADQRVGDDLDAEDIGETWAAVVTEGAKDEVLALLIEDEDTRNHVEAWWLVARGNCGITCNVL